jgi:type IV pilus biogenesis protein CpaD/CtpE
MNIILAFVISAFIFPRAYITNKDVVDAQIQRGQNIIQTNINRAHQAARDGIQNSYVRARASIAQVGTTGTDAKNTLNNASVTLKDE